MRPALVGNHIFQDGYYIVPHGLDMQIIASELLEVLQVVNGISYQGVRRGKLHPWVVRVHWSPLLNLGNAVSLTRCKLYIQALQIAHFHDSIENDLRVVEEWKHGCIRKVC